MSAKYRNATTTAHQLWTGPQLRASGYDPGTQMTDLLTDRLEISLYISTVSFAAALAGTFAIWYGIERTLSIQTIITTRRELMAAIGSKSNVLKKAS